MKYIDFHTHVFPDRIARDALERLSGHSGPYKPKTDGTASGLLRSMDRASVAISVVANIATKPTQMWPIYEFCLEIKSERLCPFVSFHPENSIQQVRQLLKKARDAGIIGVKLHPMYQGFWIDEEMMLPYYRLVAEEGLMLMFHSGYDIAFPGNEQAHVLRLKKLAKLLPELTIISTHMGGWRQWEYLRSLAEEKNLYTETSMTITETGPEEFLRLLKKFPSERILFGTDSPWTDQQEMIEAILRLPLDENTKRAILKENAIRLLKEKGFAL
jgi:predicted TIM-barrel fold metal-dependent hydrolase